LVGGVRGWWLCGGVWAMAVAGRCLCEVFLEWCGG